MTKSISVDSEYKIASNWFVFFEYLNLIAMLNDCLPSAFCFLFLPTAYCTSSSIKSTVFSAASRRASFRPAFSISLSFFGRRQQALDFGCQSLSRQILLQNHPCRAGRLQRFSVLSLMIVSR